MKKDVQIHKDVIDELAFDPQIDERNVAVAVSDGIVTLGGSVPSYAQKFALERIVKRLAGVRGIAEEVKVDLPSGHVRNDADIAGAALNALAWNSFVPTDAIQVTVEAGQLTLSGKVDWQFQRSEAEAAVRTLLGVKGVTNLIVLKAYVAPRDVKEKIERQFERTAEAEANRIIIETSGGRVILKGVVHTFAERDEAARAAWSVPGVNKVENLIGVS
jgi:osmotically-inducible protein OsmY